MKLRFRVVLMFIATVGLTSIAHAADPIIIKFSHVVADNTPKGKAALRFKEEAERRTAGKVKIEIYPNSTLYGDNDEVDALIAGKVQMIAPSPLKLGPRDFPEFEVFNLPYIFPSKSVLRRVTDGKIGQDLLKKPERKNILGLAYWDNGFYVMSANKPLRSVADFKGMKMRIPPSDVFEAQMRVLGAIPVKMAFAEAYQALKTGSVNGTQNPPSNLYTQKMHEVQKYITVSNHAYLGYMVCTNKTFWESLPSDIRVQLKLAMIDATRYANLYAEEDNNEALAKIVAGGKNEIYELTLDERETWRRALMPIHRDMEARIGRELIQSIYDESSALGHKR